jgi:outer membrane lipoprotein-sorting protein
MRNDRESPLEGALAVAVRTLRGAPISDGPGAERNDELLTAITAAAGRPKIVAPEQNGRRTRRVFEAAIAAILLVALAGLFSWVFLGNGSPALAFADLVDKLDEVRTARWTLCMQSARATSEAKFLMAPGRTRVEYENGQVRIEDHRQRKCMLLNPEKRTANIWAMDDRIVIIDRRAWENPLEMLREEVRDAKNGPDGNVELLGASQIDGRTVVGFRLKLKGKNQDTDKTIWADARTALPIRIEQLITGPGASADHSVCKDFQFNVHLDDSLFDVKPPEGYTVRSKPPE